MDEDEDDEEKIEDEENGVEIGYAS